MQLFSCHFVSWTNFITGFANPAQEYRLPIRQLHRLHTCKMINIVIVDENWWHELAAVFLFLSRDVSIRGKCYVISYLGVWRRSWCTVYQFGKSCAWWNLLFGNCTSPYLRKRVRRPAPRIIYHDFDTAFSYRSAQRLLTDRTVDLEQSRGFQSSLQRS